MTWELMDGKQDADGVAKVRNDDLRIIYDLITLSADQAPYTGAIGTL